MQKAATKLSALAASLSFVVLCSTPVFAMNANPPHVIVEPNEPVSSSGTTSESSGPGGDTDNTNANPPAVTTDPTVQPISASVSAASETKLSGAHLTACQNHATVITATMSRIANRDQKLFHLFSTTATRVETYYTSQGKVLSGYASLVTVVNTDQSAAQTGLTTVIADSTGFSCNGTDPKGALTTYINAVHDELSALETYHTAVVNLITGVKSVDATGGKQ